MNLLATVTMGSGAMSSVFMARGKNYIFATKRVDLSWTTQEENWATVPTSNYASSCLEEPTIAFV